MIPVQLTTPKELKDYILELIRGKHISLAVGERSLRKRFLALGLKVKGIERTWLSVLSPRRAARPRTWSTRPGL